MSSGQRPPFNPVTLNTTDSIDENIKSLYASSETGANSEWIPVAGCPCSFSSSMFFKAVEDLIMYPERNSPFILRSEISKKSEQVGSDPDFPLVTRLLRPESYSLRQLYKRVLIPKRPHDGVLEQSCLVAQLNSSKTNRKTEEEASEAEGGCQQGIALLVPHFKNDDTIPDEEDNEAPTTTTNKVKIPFYHPKVSAVALRYIPLQSSKTATTNDTSITIENETSPSTPIAQLRIEYLPHPDFPLPLHSSADGKNTLDTDSRVYRTAIALLGSVFRYGNGFMNGYVKRVHHDLIVPKDTYQDFYMEMKEKWTWVVSQWPEKTDPKKHVFEDIAIAAYIICLWKIMFNDGKPPGGFVDVGAGNGLLVFILCQEGYQGYGIDMRARKSWEFWKQQSEKSGMPTKLVETTLSPPDLVQTPSSFAPDTFFIGNHADEMTPWIPLLAASTERGTFINIPCCLHTLSGRFTYNTYEICPSLMDSIPESSKWLESFSSFTSEGGGRYNSYQRYLFELTLKSSFIPEREALRIPSVSEDPDYILDNAFLCGHQNSSSDLHPKPMKFGTGGGSISSSNNNIDVNSRKFLSVKDIRMRVLTRPFIQTRNIAIIGRQRIYAEDDIDSKVKLRERLNAFAMESSSQFIPRKKLEADH